MSIELQNKLNQLLLLNIKGGLLFSEWLKKNGYSDQLVGKYRKSGWFMSLAKGVMYRTGDTLSAYAAIYCYNKQLQKEFRVAAHSALELYGFNHYVPMGKPLLMIAYPKQNIPEWMIGDSFDRIIKPFSTTAFLNIQTTTVEVEKLKLLVSSPEQAFMECLLLAPMQYSYMDLYYIMEQLTSIRPENVQHLLEAINNIRVKRLFLYMAEKAGHYWFDMLDFSSMDIGASKQQLVENGVYISKYKITIPKELNDYE